MLFEPENVVLVQKTHTIAVDKHVHLIQCRGLQCETAYHSLSSAADWLRWPLNQKLSYVAGSFKEKRLIFELAPDGSCCEGSIPLQKPDVLSWFQNISQC